MAERRVLTLLLAGLPLFTRGGLSLVIAAVALLWLLWSVCSPPEKIGPISGWLLLILGIAVLTTGFSPVPMAAAKGLLKLLSYLSVYALIRKLLAANPSWWDHLLAGLLSGGLLSSVLALRQLYASTEELARWAEPNSISSGTIRIYGPLGNPNLLAGYLLPLLPLAAVALLRWKGVGSRLFAGTTLILGVSATVWTYSRGGWLGMLAGLATLMLLLILRSASLATHLAPPASPRCVVAGGSPADRGRHQTRADPHQGCQPAGRSRRSSNNFRINVWLAAIDMIQDRPWLGIGPGNAAFNSIYPLYQQPKFNALSAYSVPLELLVEMGLPGLIASLGLLWSAVESGLRGLSMPHPAAVAALASLAAIAGLLTQGITDTIFFRPEVQLIGWFCLATLAALPSDA